MARSHLRHTVRDRAGNVVQNALCRVYLQGTVSAVADMYAASSGGSAITTLTSNAQGEVEAWFTSPKYVDVKTTDNTDAAYYPSDPATLLTFSDFTETVEVPPPPGEVMTAYNVKSYGATGDGTTDDTTAIQAAITAAAAGGTVFFPPGTYIVSGAQGFGTVTNVDNLTLSGAGRASLIKRTATAGNRRIASFDGCDNLRIQNLAFDFNNITQFGGLAIENSDGVRVRDCHFFDSNLHADWVTYDHYSLVIQICSNVWVEDCLFEDIECVEANLCRRVHIRNNTSERAAGTTAFGGFAVGASYYFEDYEVVGNIILNPRKKSILFQHESGGLTGQTFRRIRIAENSIVLDDAAVAGTGAQIAFGNFTGSASSGNTWEEIWVEDNRIWVDSSITLAAPSIYAYHTQTAPVFSRCRVNRNSVVANSSDFLFDLRRLTQSELRDNRAIGTASGIGLERIYKSTVKGNHVEVTVTAYQWSTSGGGNHLSDNVICGTPTTTWSIITADNTDRFGLVRNYIDVTEFGAKGDGTTNDSAAIQAAVNVIAATSGTVYFPAGTYVLTTGLTFSANEVALVGAGRTITQIKCPAAAIGLDIGDGSTQYHYITIRGLDFTRQVAGGANTIRLRKIDQFLIQDCTIAAGTGNLRLTNCIAGHIDHNQISTQTQYGIHFDNCDQISFDGNTFETNAGGTTYHFYCVADNQAIAITGNVFSTATWAFFSDSGPSDDCLFVGNSVENCANGVLFGPAANPSTVRWTISANQLRGTATASSVGIRVYGTGHTIVANTVSNYTDSIVENSSGGATGSNVIGCNNIDVAPSGIQTTTVMVGNFKGNQQWADATNVVLGTATGTKIGTATTQKLGFFNATPVVQPSAYTTSNVTTDRTYDANATTTDELADVLGTLIADLKTLGLIG